MPTYDYQCKHCRHRFEAFQSITARPLRKCPECGQNGLKRLISAGAGVIFKGSGFYVTDYGKGRSRKPPSGGKEEKPSAGGDPSD